ncbi:MAG TPA: hypothetical protein VN894_15070 [Polyangiaceae bacterium]|nr:hypothetical protein [Polyangiaceae bacterium]
MSDRINALELEFHLATLLQDLRLLGVLVHQSSRKTWLYTVQPLQAHAVGLCSLIMESTEDLQKAAIQELFTAVLEINPPNDKGVHSNEGVWAKVKAAHGRVGAAFAGRCTAWVLADPAVSTAL